MVGVGLFGVVIVIAIIVVIVLFLYYFPLGLWIRTIAAGVPLTIGALIRMRIIGVPAGLLVSNLVRARKADAFGNLRFYRTARNFSPVMCTAAKHTIVECDELVPLGAIDPDDVHLPGIFVSSIVHVPEHEDAFEYKTLRSRDAGPRDAGKRTA